MLPRMIVTGHAELPPAPLSPPPLQMAEGRLHRRLTTA
jgi:hypothetical protein